ncbi:MAG: SsrA-binding protein [Candidatus Nealsonbacteria bacterium RIFCSPLOWO2_12_FULL_39_31]|uniref:SsrA-binding protein n=1 Tax=Candidatus Nealsonbacteria bacterium RIFCSPLOWO2_12_FULL_39_31 TaxID=1801676 RepID=A0A1G2ELG4_9BACT|nr:MAG: SsrA-binding protein [Candidatus Nealsonbacteria bacterium RIFCSPHIGHO2_02_38_10]OGZ22257.1 MAG: SsrA-binding protein [Candidatus Nealsonbacteria bacterium RIFCSPHIGHO2_02_FULL_38_75]OGZ22592.1 MAG: SsrA-binding protein [Candidatus Nealsonbacteria bacterium RIFCSPHIGHO2_12_FULL_38_18]OGZ25203.1 MAG: SsrA-binding protein [Candidatus Nealsonbacteria bacterium RIFCSPLOWO2_02_FULL_38_63]OGZ26088.1 MAG: SsrA-binding protein [Candidatus Nealsonbacteria bacterium RIFCSPLOWO2_12_FULL_39_31]
MEIFSENKKAYFNYEIKEKFRAGVVLTGQEVKSIRLGRISLAGSYVVFKDSQIYLIGAKIPAYQPKNASANYNPERPRKLLLNKSEINYLIGKSSEKGLTLIPIKVYTENAKIKLEFGIARGKKKYDKKETIRKREDRREINAELKIRG